MWRLQLGSEVLYAGTVAVSMPKAMRDAVAHRAPCVLVIDDEPDVIAVCEINLELEGYQVCTAPNGIQALEQVAAHRPDVILLDVRMPHLDGLAVLDRLKGSPATAAIPVILLTAYALPSEQAQGRARGAAAYLTKPFDPLVLVNTVRRVLSRSLPAAVPRA